MPLWEALGTYSCAIVPRRIALGDDPDGYVMIYMSNLLREGVMWVSGQIWASEADLRQPDQQG